MSDSDVKPSGDDTVRAVMSLLSRTGPEVPPDAAGSSDDPAPSPSPVDSAPSPNAVNEPTELLPVITPAASPQPPAAKIEARAVIVYEQAPRRSWGLWVFTALLVSLTVGVVLGQAAAYQPGSRAVSAAQTAPTPPYGTPAEVVPSPPGPALPPFTQPITAPLGSATTQVLEVTGASALLRIHSTDLGPLLFSAATPDRSAAPTLVTTPRGPRLDVTRTGAATGTANLEVQLSSKVRWTIRLTGKATEQQIDMRGGGLAGIELTGTAAHTVLELPEPTKTVALRITGAVTKLQIRTGDDVPVRIRLGKGAKTAVINGKKHGNVTSGAVLTSPGWRSSTNRYDVKTSAKVDSVLVEHAP